MAEIIFCQINRKIEGILEVFLDFDEKVLSCGTMECMFTCNSIVPLDRQNT